MTDIAFSPTGRLYGIDQNWLYEINPVTGALTTLGEHDIPGVTSLVFNPAGKLQAMGSTQGVLYQLEISDTALIRKPRAARHTQRHRRECGSRQQRRHCLLQRRFVGGDERRLADSLPLRCQPHATSRHQSVRPAGAGDYNVFGLATVGGRLFATAETSVYQIDISIPQFPTVSDPVPVNSAFGSLRGTAYYGEAGGPVPAGTLSGVKWFDRNKDGLRQLQEPTLSDWFVYIDTDLNGSYDAGEPLRRTDDEGRYYFFGREPGLYTVDEIILDTELWEQTYPQTTNRNIVGIYDFENSRATMNSTIRSAFPI